jgi:murein DD-endopeptidase MepM/ murein hydrolase activator NlpD
VGGLVRLGALTAAALIVVAPAAAHTDGVRQLDLRWPAVGTVTRGWGYDAGEFHKGIDIGTLRSLDVHAAAQGVVVSVGYETGFEGYGEIVLVDHGNGLETLYAHLSGALVEPGQVVGAGQRVGVAGCTGYCTGTHLHFELREDGVAIDPALLMRSTIPGSEGG